jgi:HAD superfamily hydrolase (TIGR01509 family)
MVRPLAVIFDMDGLLFDTERLIREALFTACLEVGYQMTDAVHRRMVGCQWPIIEGLLTSHFGQHCETEVLRAAWVRQFKSLLPNLQIKPGAIGLLQTLDELRLPRAIATSSNHDDARHYLAMHNLTGRFHQIIASGDYSRSKPFPDPYLKAAQLLGVDPASCLALEDSYIGVRSAAAAGMMTVMVPDILEADEEMRGLCVYIASDLDEVRERLISMSE